MKNKWLKRFVWLVILILHLVLLKWIFFALNQTGYLETEEVFMHFLGMSVYGAVLIRLCAWIYHRQYRITQKGLLDREENMD